MKDIDTLNIRIKQLENENTLLENENNKLKETYTNQYEELCDRMHKSQQFIEVIINSVADPIFVKDIDKLIIVNDAFCDFIGYSRLELLHNDYKTFFDNSEYNTFIHNDSHVFETGCISITEEPFTNRNGDTRIVSTKRSRFWNKTTSKYLLVGSMRDITESKIMEQQLISAKLEAESANNAKSDFLANMSHELRTPISNIMGLVQLIESKTVDPNLSDYIGMIKTSCNHLISLITDVLDLTKIEAGRFNIDEVTFLLSDFLHEIFNQYNTVAKEKNILFYCSIDSRIPQYIKTDMIRLKQIIMNLLDNAFKFTKSGEVCLELNLDDEGNIDKLYGTIYDTGIGINNEQQKKIFEKFVQVDTSYKREFQGAGLGLAICRRLTELLNGRLWVESELNGFSAFHFEIEIKEADDTIENSSCRICTSENKLYRILIAEDHEIGGMIIKTFLEDNNYYVDLVTNGKDALINLNWNYYDLVIMDIQMPIMDGLTAINKIRSGKIGNIDTDIPIIALTAYAMTGDKKKIISAGADEYITKPFEKDELLTIVKQILNRGKSCKEKS